MSDIVKLETVKFGPCRFVGASVYLENKGKWGDLTAVLWERSAWIFKMLDDLQEYATEEPHNAAITTWEKCDDKNALFGYYIGRFMKAGTPVPHDLDYFDIDAEYMTKVWVRGKFRDGKYGDLWNCPRHEIDKTKYTGVHEYNAEVYPEPDENGESFIGYYRPCNLKNSDL